MRYLRTQNINRRAPFDTRLNVDLSNGVVMGTTNNLLLPKGTTNERPLVPKLGMIRYNTTTDEVEIYQGLSDAEGVWRSVRYKESTQITQQYKVFYGDGINTVFGPLIPPEPTVTETNSTWTGANLIVIVENVVQVYDNNYLISTDGIDYFIEFDEPVPDGIEVIVIHGFDR